MPEKRDPRNRNIMTAQKIGKYCMRERRKTIFFTIIADILFGYCNVFAGVKLSSKHKNDLV
jgi:hypothetical protein